MSCTYAKNTCLLNYDRVVLVFHLCLPLFLCGISWLCMPMVDWNLLAARGAFLIKHTVRHRREHTPSFFLVVNSTCTHHTLSIKYTALSILSFYFSLPLRSFSSIFSFSLTSQRTGAKRTCYPRMDLSRHSFSFPQMLA